MAEDARPSSNGGEASTRGTKKRQKVFLNREVVIHKLLHRHKELQPSPLVQLKEILEETNDKGRFVGDTMFWKYFEDIDIQRVYHTNSVEYRNLKVMFWEVCFYLFLLLMFTIYVYQLQSRDSYDAREEQANYWSGCDGSGDTCRIKEVESVSSFWTWMQTELIPRAFTTYEVTTPVVAKIMTTFASNDFPLTFSPRFVGAQMSNIMLGSVRLRQLRVQKNQGCQVSKLASHVFPDCYGPYSNSFRSTANYAPRFGPTYLKSAFEWQDSEVTRQTSIRGTMNEYDGDGFVIDLPFNKSDSAAMVKDLWQSSWVDSATRAVVIELSVLNTNVNVIVNSRILFEFSPTGSVVGKVDTNAARVLFFTPATKAGAARSVFSLQIVLLIIFLIFSIYVFWLMYKTCHNFLGEHPLTFLRKAKCMEKVSIIVHTIYHYFRYGWNFVDLIIITLFFTHMGFRCDTYAAKGREAALAPGRIGHPEVFMPFSRVMLPLTASNNVLSLLAMVIWVKLFKYLCMSSYFRLIVRILEKCAARLVVFSFLLLVVFFGFAVAFSMGFGGTVKNFSTLSGSFLVLFFLLIDGFTVEAEWFQPGKDTWMPIMFVVYIAVIYFVILNIFIAIVLDVYATSDHGERERQHIARTGEERKNPMAVFCWTYFNWMKGLSLVRDEAEEFLKTEDLSICLELLPGIVRRKWVEKKQKMQKVASEAFAGMELFPDDPAKVQDQGNEEGHLAMSDWSLPSTSLDVFKEMSGNRQPNDKPVALYEVPASTLKQEVSKEQLQRLMDEDETLPLLLGSKRAVDVIRRFKASDRPDTGDTSALEDVSPAKKLQRTVFGKIDELEKVKFENENEDDRVTVVPEIVELTELMSSSVSDVRNEFRVQLTVIIEATAQLFEHLTDLTQGVDGVRKNVESVVDQVHENQRYRGDSRRPSSLAESSTPQGSMHDNR